jgi:cadmium resistance protein CadD (predicted permease)
MSWGGSVFSVTVVTVSNGGDNVGVYIPLFAASEWERVGLILGVFGILTGVWCVAGYWLGTHPLATWHLRHRGPRVIAWILIALGLYILVANRAWTVFP